MMNHWITNVSKLTHQAINICPDAYEAGIDAGIDGKDPDENPYRETSTEWIAWRAGWLGVC